MVVNHNKYRLFEYENNPSKNDEFILGEVVFKKDSHEIGVIIQCHGNNEYRTDKFGNCCFDVEQKYSSIVKAELTSIKKLRPNLLDNN
jgi:hypothetical protein